MGLIEIANSVSWYQHMKDRNWWWLAEIRRDSQAQRVCSPVGGSSRQRQYARCRLGQSRVGWSTFTSTTGVSGIGTRNLPLPSSPVDAFRWETWFVLFHTTWRYLTRFCARQAAVPEVGGSCSSPPQAPPCACQTYGIEYPTGYAESHFQYIWPSHRFA